jgi:hypothetical protein
MNPLNPGLSTPSDTRIEFPKLMSESWQSPMRDTPDFSKIALGVKEPITGIDFSEAVKKLTPAEIQDKYNQISAFNSVGTGLEPYKAQTFRTFSQNSADRYIQNEKLWKTVGFNPEIPRDMMDAVYDHNESWFDSFKNIIPKLWHTTKFAYGNYFAEYADVVSSMNTLDQLHNKARFQEYSDKMKNLEDLYPDYKTDKEIKWHDTLNPFGGNMGDAWEESSSSIGFTIGTLAAAITEGAAIAALTSGFGSGAATVNSGRKIYKSISEYYSFKRGMDLIKSVVKGKTITDKLKAGVDLWRLTNGALSEATFEGALNKIEYLEKFKQDYIDTYGFAPSQDIMMKASRAGDEMAKKTILFQTPFLMLSNAAQFGNILAPKLTSQLGKSFAKITNRQAGKFIVDDMYNLGVETLKKSKLESFGRFMSNGVWEGTEESYQAFVTKSTQDYYNDKYFNTPNNSLIKSLGEGFDYVTSNDGMKEFAAGFATGTTFKLVGLPMHALLRPSLRKPEINKELTPGVKPEEKEKEKDTVKMPNIEDKYKLNFMNKYFGVGMKKILNDHEIDIMKYQAAKLNAAAVKDILQSNGFIDMIKDRKTSLSMAKFIETGDLFNLDRAQNIQLLRFMHAGAAQGKLDEQLDRLTAFANQDFGALKLQFDRLATEEFSTKESQDQFMNSLKTFSTELKGRASEFQKLFDVEIVKHKNLKISNAIFTASVQDSYNNMVTALKLKYGENFLEEELEEKERKDFNQLNSLLSDSFIYHAAIDSIMQAGIFSQFRMNHSAKRASQLIDQLNSDDILGSKLLRFIRIIR